MDDKRLKNIWNQLTADNKTQSDFETWKNNIASKENVQDNVHSYLSQNGFVESDLDTWKDNVGLKKKDSSESNGEMEVTESITEQVQEGNGSSDSSSGEEDIMLVGETIDPPKKQEQPPQKTSRFDPMSVEPITAPETEQQFEAPTIPEEQFENLDYVKKVKDYDQSLIDNNIYENKDQIRDMRYEMASGFLGESDKREYELLQKIKKVDEKIEIYKDPEQNKWLRNSEKALSDAIKEKEGYEQSLTKIKEQYLNENQEAIKKARFELSKDPENKQLKENLLKLQTKYKSFFKPVEAAKEIYVSTPEMQKQEGETPYEKFLNYYDAAVLEYDEARDAMRASDMVLSTIPLIDDISGASPVIRRYVRAYKKLEALTPIALLNRKALKEDNFFSQLGKSALSTFSDASLSTTEQEESSIVFDVLQKADVGKDVSEENIKALESSFDMTTGEKAGSMLGATIAMMPAFMAGGGAVRGLKNITKLGRAFDKLKDTNRFSKFLLGAVEQGVSYEAAQFFGDESIKDEASFLSGALGETFSKGLSAVGKRNVYMQIMLKAFGNNASKASKFLAIAAQRTGTGLGEMAEEYGNELGNIINESDGDLKKVKDLWVERFGKLDQNLEFGLSTFGMGVLFGSATKAGQQFADTYKDWLSGQTDDVKAKFGEIEKEVNQDAQKIVNEVAEDVAEEAAPEAAAEVEVTDEVAPEVKEEVTEEAAPEVEVEGKVTEEAAPEVEVKEQVTEEAAPDIKIQEERKQKINPEETVAYEDIEKSINEGLKVSEKLSKIENPEIAESNKKDIKDIKDNREDITSQDIIDTITSDEFIDEYGDWQKAKEQYDNLPTNEKTKENRLKILSENNVTVMTDKNMMPRVMFHGTKASREQLKDGLRGGSFVTNNMDYAKHHGRVLKGFVKIVGKISKKHSDDRNIKFPEESNYIEYTENEGIIKDGSQFKEIKKPLKPEVKVELEQAKTPGERITTTEEQTLFKGMQPKIKDGKPFSAHKIEKGEFAAADEKLASNYKGDKPLKKFTLPAGTTVDVVQVEDTKQTLSETRKQEGKLIDDSDAQVVKLITRDASGTVEEQYIIKDDAILESAQDVDETQQFIDEDAFELMTAPDGDSMYDIIKYGRSKDIPDAAIRKVLIDRKFKAKDIDAALEINLDIFTKIPVEFQTVADGAKSAVKLFQEVKKELDKFINKNKKTSVTKVREQGIKILKSNPIFKKQNALVKMQLIDGFNRSINLKKGNFTFQKKINNLRKSIRDRVKGTKDLAKVIQEMKRMALSNVSTLQLSKDERKVLNDIIKSIGSLTMVNVKIETEKILNAIQKKRASDKVKTIKSIKKLIKDSSTRKAKIGKDAKSFFKSAKDIFQTLTSGDQIKIDALAAAINENQYLNDQIQEKVDKEEKLTPKEIKIYNDFLAYKMFNNIDNMTLEEVIEVYNGLKSDKKEGIQVLKDIQSIESKKRLEEEAEAVNQIKETNPELFDDKGNLLDNNQIKAKRLEIYKKFKQLKIPEAISDYVKLFKYGGYTYMIRSLKNNLMNNLETLTNIADRTTKGFNLFRKKIYDKLNVMNTNRLAGLQAMEKKLNSIVDNIGAKYKSKTGVTLKGYKAIQVIAQRKGSMEIDGIVSSLGGKSIGTFGPSELMTIYAYWKNENVKKKLEKQGFTQDKIDAIEKHLGKELTAFADSIVDFLSNEYYDGINEVYSEVNYNNLGAIENYFPLTTLSTEKDSKKYSELTKDGNFSESFNTETAPYWKARTDKETDVDLTDIDFFTKLDRYINTMEGYKAYAKGAKELQSFFEIPAVKILLKNLYIDNAIRAFVLKQLSPNSLGVDAYKGFAPFRGLLSNMTRVVLGFKTIQIAKQAISFIQAFPKYDYFGKNYKGKVPSIIRRRADLMMFLIDAARMYASLGKDLIGKDGVIAEALEASPDFKDRWTQALKGDVYSLESGTGIRLRGGRRKFTRADRGAAKLAAIQGAPTTIGDVLGVLGYMVNYKRNIANGMNKSDALRLLNDYNSTQQTRRETERTQLQGSKNPLVRTFLMFGSAIFAQQNKLAQSTRNIYRSIFSSQIPKTEDVRSFVINGFLVNILFEMTANIFRLIKGDDEDLKEVMDSLKEIMLFTKQLYAVPLIGSTLEELDLGGKAIAYLDDEFYEKPKFRSQDVVNPFNVIYRRTVKNADSDRGFLFNAARPAAEALVGFNVDPFIGTYNYFSADKMDFMEQEEEMMNALGVTPSYQPNRLRQEIL